MTAARTHEYPPYSNEIKEVSRDRFAIEDILRRRPPFISFRAVETTAARRRTVLLTAVAHSDLPRLIAMRTLLSEVNDARIGVEYASYSTKESQFAYLVSTFHTETKSLLSHVSNASLTETKLLSMLISMAEQLNEIHSVGFSHGDVSPNNFLIDKTGEPHIVDFELSQPLKPIQGQSSFPLGLGGTPGYIHPRVIEAVAEGLDSRHSLPEDRIRWDIYSFGKTLLAILNSTDIKTYINLNGYFQRAIQLIATRCLDGLNQPDEVALGLLPSAYNSICYSTMEEVRIDLEKLRNPSLLLTDVPELNESSVDRIQVSSIAPAIRTKRLSALLNSAEFQLLKNIKQLGLINLVYPGAQHSRAEHAIGTYAMAAEYIKWLLRDTENPLFAQLMRPQDLRRVLVAALLHDIGHFPLAHDLEEVDRDLFDHERLGILQIKSSAEIVKAITSPEPEGWGLDIDDVLTVLDDGPATDSNVRDGLLHSLISGPIDADKLDYLTRDSERTGTAYGRGIDIARLSTSMTTVVSSSGGKSDAAIGVIEKGVGPAETIAFARYTTFRAVYWHHAYRSIKAMIQFIVLEYLRTRYLASHKLDRKGVLDSLLETVGVQSFQVISQRTLDELGSEIPPSTVLPDREDRVLRWAVGQPGSRSAHLYGVLSQGQWYKRLLVLSYGRDLQSAQLGKDVEEVFGGKRPPQNQWMRKWLAQVRFQRLVVERVGQLKSPEIVTVMLDSESKVVRFIDSCKSSQVLLIDFPDPSRSLGGELKFLIESESVRTKIDRSAELPVGASEVFKHVSQDFIGSIGKLRVLCAEAQRDFLQRYLSRETIIDCLAKALHYASTVTLSQAEEFAGPN